MDDRSADALSDTPEAADRDRWLELLAELDPESLTDRFLAQVGTVPGYDPAPIPVSELRRTGTLSFISLIEGLRAGGFAAPVPVATDVGVSRARAGIPLTSLMTAIRHDFTVLWEALTRAATAEDAQLIVRHTNIVLRTVDDYVHQTEAAYLAELQRMNEEQASVRQGLIAALFQDVQPGSERLETIAADLGLGDAAPLHVVAAVDDDVAALRVHISELERAGGKVFTHHLGETLIAFMRQVALPGSRLSEVAVRVLDLRVGITLAPGGVVDLRRAATTAASLARAFVADESGAMTWSRGWARLAARSLLDAGNPILADVHDALARCTPAERARLEEAARSYLETGSIGAAADALFCHRNTLANRLRRFADLTGVDPLVPADAARLVVGWA
ncbi:helix-turn-helix domain-containing protein [Leucobacter sp. L43]|uniref:helix-turn-helix domain-containing protein n=1 Tax=Leucobacter sp. L43 TaxID=2798040 RepID=UPI00190375EB|nr:helix-turn-helix domain-containing protein [Leucobacter sp. L43]